MLDPDLSYEISALLDKYGVNIQDISDGSHSMNELYVHRNLLFIALLINNRNKSWYSDHHSDGSRFDGYLICGTDLPTGQVTYHVKYDFKKYLVAGKIPYYNIPPKWDGHSSTDVILRLKKLILAFD